MLTLDINGKSAPVEAESDTPLLWVLRDTIKLTGTKYGCGMALCGACTVHLDGQAVRSCVTPVSAAVGRKIITIEAVGNGRVGKAVQDAWRRLWQHKLAVFGLAVLGVLAALCFAAFLWPNIQPRCFTRPSWCRVC